MTSPDFDYQFHQFLSQRQLFKKPVVLTYEDRDMYDFQEDRDQYNHDPEYQTYISEQEENSEEENSEEENSEEENSEEEYDENQEEYETYESKSDNSSILDDQESPNSLRYLIDDDSSTESEYESESNYESDMEDLIRSQTIIEPEWNVQSVSPIPSPIQSPLLSISSQSPPLSLSPAPPSPSPSLLSSPRSPSPQQELYSPVFSEPPSPASSTASTTYSSNTIDTLTEQVNYQNLEFHSQIEELTEKCQSLQTQIILLHTQLEEEKKDKKDALILRNDAIEARDYILDRCEKNIRKNDAQHDQELQELKKRLEEITEERDDMMDERDQALEQIEEWKKENLDLTQHNEVCRNAYRKILKERVHDFSRLASYTLLRYNIDKYLITRSFHKSATKIQFWYRSLAGNSKAQATIDILQAQFDQANSQCHQIESNLQDQLHSQSILLEERQNEIDDLENRNVLQAREYTTLKNSNREEVALLKLRHMEEMVKKQNIVQELRDELRKAKSDAKNTSLELETYMRRDQKYREEIQMFRDQLIVSRKKLEQTKKQHSIDLNQRVNFLTTKLEDFEHQNNLKHQKITTLKEISDTQFKEIEKLKLAIVQKQLEMDKMEYNWTEYEDTLNDDNSSTATEESESATPTETTETTQATAVPTSVQDAISTAIETTLTTIKEEEVEQEKEQKEQKQEAEPKKASWWW